MIFFTCALRAQLTRNSACTKFTAHKFLNSVQAQRNCSAKIKIVFCGARIYMVAAIQKFAVLFLSRKPNAQNLSAAAVKYMLRVAHTHTHTQLKES